MTSKRTIFIGDIHGCYDEFMLLLEKLQVLKDETVYLVGDIINKGPKSYEVLDFVYQNRDQFKAIKGNHEINILKFIEGNTQGRTPAGIKDMQKTFEQIGDRIELIEYLRNLPLSIETPNFLMIHGGLIPGKDISDHHVDEITRLREYEGQPWHSYYTGEKPIIYGHWAVQGLHITDNTICLDSGCVYGKELTAYILETKKIISQKALKQYKDPFKDYTSWKK
ncbi:metallophosphoesterase [Candidatus Gracilibacteria bacterium]|nr:metallophosphoesterase [Candidatus Gracilibacteria bacterium]